MKKDTLKYTFIAFCAIGYVPLSFLVPAFNVFRIIVEILFAIIHTITIGSLDSFPDHLPAVMVVAVLLCNVPL